MYSTQIVKCVSGTGLWGLRKIVVLNTIQGSSVLVCITIPKGVYVFKNPGNETFCQNIGRSQASGGFAQEPTKYV